VCGRGRFPAQPRSATILRHGSTTQGGSAPALGMGSWRLGQGRRPATAEEEALRTGLSLGMTLVDTAEMYGNGTSEEMVGRVIGGQREKVFLVSKVLPSNATRADDIRRACAASLTRLKTDYMDLYLLHWRGGVRAAKPRRIDNDI